MKKLQFKTNSRHISQLGRELVTDFVTALVELIKNSYDADAYGVKIILDKPNTPQSRIVLIDTGTGMTQSDFENKWMVIGTNNKITEPYTPKGRKKAGKKGIGRFSVERLAEKVQIYSFPEFEPPYRVDINWNSFEEINIPALTQRIGILKDHQESTAAKFICNQLEYFMVTDKILQEDKDTVESILGTKSFEYPMFYKNETLRLLEDKVVPIIKKYEDIELLIGDVSSSLDTIDSQSESEVFTMLEELYIKFNLSKSQTGMILIMEGLRDEWKQRDIDKLQKELRLLVAPDFIESDPFKIELVAPEFKVEDIVLVNEILDLRYAKIDAEIFDNAQKSRIIYSDKEGKNDIVEENYEKPLLCGNLKAEIYFFLRDSANLSDAESGYNFRFAQRILDTYCGIKIYRDNFRVKPYGDIGNDWLLLDQKKVKDTHGYLVGNNQVIGVVTLIDEILLKFQYNAELHDLKDLIYQLDNLRHLKQQELGKLPKDEMFEKAEEYLNDKGIENSLVFEEYNMDFKMKFNGSTYYCELLVDNSLEEKTEYRKNISVEKLTTWFEKLNSNFGILFYYPRINRMYFYPVSNNMTLPEITDGKKIRQIKINDKCLL